MPLDCLKYLLFLTSFILAGPDLNAQTDCSPVYKLFDTGRAKVWHSTSGEFWKAPHQGNGFEISDSAIANEPVQVTREAGLWIIGKDDGGNIKSSLPKPIGRGWHPGPLNAEGASTPELCNNYNKIWEVTRADIDALRADFIDNGVIDQPIPFNLRAWPGKNNPFFKEANGFDLPVDVEFAPFWDYGDNGVPDGNYNPEKGDFPYAQSLVNHIFPEIIQWWVINDVGLETASQNIPLQMQAEITAISVDNSCIKNSSIFYELKLVNKGVEPLNKTRIGFWMNSGLGCKEDDYFGCDSLRNLVFVYNSNDTDGGDNCSCDSDEIAMCDANAMFGMAVLRGPLDVNFQEVGLKTINYFDNNPDAREAMQPPNSFDAYDNYLGGKWSDGTPVTRFGNGYNPTSLDTVHYIFSDRPSEADGWNMCTASDVDQLDPTIICAYADFTLLPGAWNRLTFVAMVTDPIEQEACGPMYALFNQLEDNFDKISWHSDFVDPCVPPPEPLPPLPEINLEVFPNPASEFIIIKPKEGKQLREVRLIDTSGRIINEFKNIQEEELRIENPMMNGIFFIQIITTDDERSTHKILFHT